MDDDLMKFLNARLDEDEVAAKGARTEYFTPEVLGQFSAVGDMCHVIRYDPARVLLREVPALRAIVGICLQAVKDQGDWHEDGQADVAKDILAQLAAVWSDHPEYRQEWKL